MTRREFLGGAVFSAAPGPVPVLIDHDGGFPDDYLATALVLAAEHVGPLGVVVTPADCFLQPAVSATRKLLGLMRRIDIPVAASHVRGLNPFPDAWRRGAYTIDGSPILRGAPRAPLARQDGPRFLAGRLREAPAPVTLFVTGPLSTVAAALDLAPGIEAKIREIVWMGGALEARGNVDQPGHDGSAEWNVYWDPLAAARVWKSAAPIVLCPLECTNQAPVTRDFVRRLEAKSAPVARLAAQSYGAVAGKEGFYLWDVVTAAYLGHPRLFTMREREVEIVTEGRSQGRTRLRPGARRVRALDSIDVEGFYAYVADRWSQYRGPSGQRSV